MAIKVEAEIEIIGLIDFEKNRVHFPGILYREGSLYGIEIHERYFEDLKDTIERKGNVFLKHCEADTDNPERSL